MEEKGKWRGPLNDIGDEMEKGLEKTFNMKKLRTRAPSIKQGGGKGKPNRHLRESGEE